MLQNWYTIHIDKIKCAQTYEFETVKSTVGNKKHGKRSLHSSQGNRQNNRFQ